METEEIIRKIAADLSKNVQTDATFPQKQARFSEIIQKYAIISKNDAPKAPLFEEIKQIQRDFSGEDAENKENVEKPSEIPPKNATFPANPTKIPRKKSKEDSDFEEMLEFSKYLEKLLNHQENFRISLRFPLIS